jgi:hypothetical protein
LVSALLGQLYSFLFVKYLQLDKDHGLYHKIKSHRLKTRGDRVVRVLTDNANPGVVKGGSDAGEALSLPQIAVGFLTSPADACHPFSYLIDSRRTCARIGRISFPPVS